MSGLILWSVILEIQGRKRRSGEIFEKALEIMKRDKCKERALLKDLKNEIIVAKRKIKNMTDEKGKPKTDFHHRREFIEKKVMILKELVKKIS